MKRIITAGINDYPGRINDLRYCLNGSKNILNLFNDFDEKVILKNSEVTKGQFKGKALELIRKSEAGDILIIHYTGHGTQIPDKNGDEIDGYDEALYLYDGAFSDDEFNEILSELKDGVTCVVLLDCCHSGTATKGGNVKYVGPEIWNKTKARKIRRKQILVDEEMKWTVISACSSNQTSIDSSKDFTYWLCHTAKKGQTLKEWYKKLIKTPLARKYGQNPCLEGIGFDKIIY